MKAAKRDNKMIIKKLLSNFWSKEFWRYFVIGASSVLLDMGTLYCFKEFFGLAAIWSLVLNQLLVYSFVFFLNKFWAFSARGAVIRQMVRYCLLALLNYIIAIAWMYFFHNLLGGNYLLARLSNIILATAWNFLLYRFFVYTKRQNS